MSSKKTKAKDYDYLFKLVLIGDSGVGKSCLLLRFAVSSILFVGHHCFLIGDVCVFCGDFIWIVLNYEYVYEASL